MRTNTFQLKPEAWVSWINLRYPEHSHDGVEIDLPRHMERKDAEMLLNILECYFDKNGLWLEATPRRPTSEDEHITYAIRSGVKYAGAYEFTPDDSLSHQYKLASNILEPFAQQVCEHADIRRAIEYSIGLLEKMPAVRPKNFQEPAVDPFVKRNPTPMDALKARLAERAPSPVNLLETDILEKLSTMDTAKIGLLDSNELSKTLAGQLYRFVTQSGHPRKPDRDAISEFLKTSLAEKFNRLPTTPVIQVLAGEILDAVTPRLLGPEGRSRP